jgi:hypothetical protein
VDGLLSPADGRLRDLVSSQAMMSVTAINAAIIFYALALVRRAEVELEQQHERSEALIATVMPAAIAARLRSSEERIADRIENLTVLFADLRRLHGRRAGSAAGGDRRISRQSGARARCAGRAVRRGKDQDRGRLLHGGGRL